MDSLIDNIKGLQQQGTKILFDANILRFEITRRRFSLKEFLPIMQYHRYGFINRKGNIVIEPIYDDFKGELSRKTSVCVKKKDKWGIIASNGEVVADFEYDFIFPSIVDYTNYQENCAYFEQLYTACRNHQWGILKNDGNIFVEFGKYDWIDGYDSGLARVKQKEKWGMIDYMGQIALPIEYENIWNFYNRNRSNTIIEKDDTRAYVEFEGLLSKYIAGSDDNEVDYDDIPSSKSAYDNPYYNENLDFDQQSPEFWDSF